VDGQRERIERVPPPTLKIDPVPAGRNLFISDGLGVNAVFLIEDYR
jgi:hypothetical protein